MLNKPRGLVTSAADERGRDTIYSAFATAGLPWLAPVGRLDKASEGLLLLTNDSEWSARITSPAAHLDKTYHVQIAALPEPDLLARMCAGVRDEGEALAVKSARELRRGGKNAWLEIVLDEGRNGRSAAFSPHSISAYCASCESQSDRSCSVTWPGESGANLNHTKWRR